MLQPDLATNAPTSNLAIRDKLKKINNMHLIGLRNFIDYISYYIVELTTAVKETFSLHAVSFPFWGKFSYF